MRLLRFFVVVILVFLPATGLSEKLICDGEYKERQPNKVALDNIHKDHSAWLESRDENDKRRANLCKADLRLADLSGANLSGADLSGANLSGADLSGANLAYADLSGADLSKANLSKATLFNAELIEADLSGANLSGVNLIMADLSWANLSGADLSGANLLDAKLKKAQLINTKLLDAKFTDVDLNKAYYEPISAPDKAFLSGIQNLKTVSFENGKQSGLVLLRNSLKDSGLRELEREATYAIEKGVTNYTSSWLQRYTRRIFFEWTAGYGLYPEKCLIILLSLIPVFTIIYLFPIYSKKDYLGQHKSGIYRIWINDRIRKDLGSNEPELITAGFWKGISYAVLVPI